MELQYLFIIIAIIILLSIAAYFLIFNKRELKTDDKESNLPTDYNNIETIDNKENNIDSATNIEQPEYSINPETLIDNEGFIEVIDDFVSDDKPKVKINISSKTEKLLIKKLENFEQSKAFIRKDVNLNNLAKQFDTNTKYLSEIIKTYKNKNFNQYLNELRINHLINELNTNEKVLNTKVSYLASDFGFNSHSSFSTLFIQKIGQSPSDYIKTLKENKKIKTE